MSQASAATDSGVHGARDDAHALERIRDALRGLRFGTVSVIVQDGVVVSAGRPHCPRCARSNHSHGVQSEATAAVAAIIDLTVRRVVDYCEGTEPAAIAPFGSVGT